MRKRTAAKDSLSFQVIGVALPAPRPSVGRTGVYMDRRSEHWKFQVRDSAVEAMQEGAWPRERRGPVEVWMRFVMVRRDSRTGASGLPHDCRPDLDNLVKLVMDGMTRAGVYKDDGAVVRIVASKRWQFRRERFAGVRVVVTPVFVSADTSEDTSEDGSGDEE